MPNVRKSFRAMGEGAILQINNLIADITAVVAGDKPFNSVRALSALTKLIADLLALRTPLAAAVVDLTALQLRYEHVALISAAIAQATTAGKLKTTVATTFGIGGTLYSKAITDNLWDLSAESATDGTHYRAYWLYLDSSGTASIAGGTDALSANAAIAALPAITGTKSVIGVFVAGLSTNFANALGAQGTIYNGFAAAYTLTTAAPAAMTATTSLGIGNGTTAGRLRTNGNTEYTIAGTHYFKVPTDNLWDLHSESSTAADKYRAYVLYLDSAGTATFAHSTTDQTTSDLAIADLGTLSTTKAVIGVYVAAPSTNFANALAAQGTIADGSTGTISSGVTAETIVLVSN